MKTLIIYNKETGLITKTVTCPDSLVVCQAAEGEGQIVPTDEEMALMRSRGDSAVIVSGGVLSAHTPAKPETDGLTDYTWDESTCRWEGYRTAEGLAVDVRSTRGLLLSESDWVVTKALEDGESVPTEWKAYRAALRDITLQSGFPQSVEWPTKPE